MDDMRAIPRLIGEGIEEKSCKEEDHILFFLRRIQHILSLLCDLVDVGRLTRSLQLLHPPEFVHRVLQTSDLVVVEEKKSEAGQMIQGPCVKDLDEITMETFYLFIHVLVVHLLQLFRRMLQCCFFL